MEMSKIITVLQNEIIELRESVCKAGDTADVVYIGEDIGKLEVAISLIKTYAEDNDKL